MEVRAKNNRTDKKLNVGWLAAISEAERQIAEHKRHVAQLKGSVEIFKRKLANGEPWPGKSATQN